MLLGSQNYIWWTKDHLGKGATAAVFKCRNKRTGGLFAVKTFNPVSFQRPDNVQMREFEVLRKLHHENIVRLWAIEEEQTTKSRVIIMEYCNGGSLYAILDQPKNMYGLDEGDFLDVLGDVTAGMKHLNDQKIVHRDIKPGNIMCMVRPDARPIYKLTDFGAARELDDPGESFQSLYGTEEYLHPDLYDRAVMKNEFGRRRFDSSIDLWSLGVTIYHVATGSLPFRPKGGRKNRESMSRILTGLQDGCVSGVEQDSGNIKYSRVLPQSCQISYGLRLLITPLLAILFSAKRDLAFKDFYIRVGDILTRRCVHVVALYPGKMLCLYMRDPNFDGPLSDSHPGRRIHTSSRERPTRNLLESFKEGIHEQSAIPIAHQLLLYENGEMEEADARDALKSTTVNSPIFCFTAVENNDKTPEIKSNIPGLPRVSAALHVEADYTLSKELAGKAHLYRRVVEEAHRLQRLYGRAVRIHEGHLVRSVRGGMAWLDQVIAGVSETTQRHEFFTKHCHLCRHLLEGFCSGYPQRGGGKDVGKAAAVAVDRLARIQNELDGLVREMNQHMPDLERYAREYNEKLVVKKELSAKWRNDKCCREEERCVAQAQALTRALSDTAKEFKKDRMMRTLGYNDEQIHKFEKNRMSENCQRALALAQDQCFGNLRSLHKQFVAWFAMSFKVQQKFVRLEKKVQNQFTMQKEFSKKLTARQDRFNQLITEVAEKLHQSASSSVNRALRVQEHPELRMRDNWDGAPALAAQSPADPTKALRADSRTQLGAPSSQGDSGMNTMHSRSSGSLGSMGPEFSSIFNALSDKNESLKADVADMRMQVERNVDSLNEIAQYIEAI